MLAPETIVKRPWGAWRGRQALSLAKAEGRTGVV